VKQITQADGPEGNRIGENQGDHAGKRTRMTMLLAKRKSGKSIRATNSKNPKGGTYAEKGNPHKEEKKIQSSSVRR